MIHVITGPPCAGKSTYVKENAKDGDLRIDYDLIALALGSMKSHAAEGAIKQAAFDAREGAIQTALKYSDAESWIIHTTPSEEHIKMYTDAGAEFIDLDPGYESCMERARQDGRPQQTFDGIEKYYAGKKGRKRRKKKMITKEFKVKYKDDGNGMLEGYASTWVRTPDSYGDVVKSGAFAKTLQERWNGGKGIPLLWAHQMDNLNAFIGMADADEDDIGLHFVASFDDTPEAQRVRQLYKDGRLRKFSFAYDVMDEAPVELEDGIKANELRELDLYEISCVTVPANDTAEVLDVKAGRRNSGKDESTIRDAISALEGAANALKALLDNDDGKDDPEDNPAGEDQKESNPKIKELLDYINEIKEKK